MHEMEMESVVARHAKESLELAFWKSQILDTSCDRHTLSLLMALCDRQQWRQPRGPRCPHSRAVLGSSSDSHHRHRNHPRVQRHRRAIHKTCGAISLRPSLTLGFMPPFLRRDHHHLMQLERYVEGRCSSKVRGTCVADMWLPCPSNLKLEEPLPAWNVFRALNHLQVRVEKSITAHILKREKEWIE
uniref:Uncharacterized protein n=3 Tax=Oryza sativa subsp. japonica TaxID=39947 RepID=Q60DD1_ORYSJ|nr:hypothetical protein [Oryza sativa Japonica Group]ABF96804.1 hypothetical protein LOC_Os03g32140 [Oryza sativa Japonica Group]